MRKVPAPPFHLRSVIAKNAAAADDVKRQAAAFQSDPDLLENERLYLGKRFSACANDGQVEKEGASPTTSGRVFPRAFGGLERIAQAVVGRV